MLERGEQGVELGKMGSVVGFELVHLDDAGGKGVLTFPAGMQDGNAI